MTQGDGIEFLQNLDKKVHYIDVCTSGVYAGAKRDAYHKDKKILKCEIVKVLDIVQEEQLPFYPINTNWGFDIGFSVDKVLEGGFVRKLDGHHLRFIEDQLPKGYDFDKLSETFLSERNKQLMKGFGIGSEKIFEEMENRHRYEY